MLAYLAVTRSHSRAGFFVGLLLAGLLAPARPLAAQGRLEGRLYDRDSGAAVAGALLLFQPTADPSQQYPTHSDTTGTFRFDKLPLGPGKLSVEMLGYAPLQQTLEIVSDQPSLDLFLQPQALVIDEVVVQARRPGQAQHSAAFVETIPLSQQAAPGANIAQVLDRATAVNVRRSGGLGSFSTVSIRGSTAEQVQIFLDGVPLNSATGGGVDLGQLPLGGVESVQIYRGAVPARFGGNSMGGVVHIRSRQLPDNLQGRLHASLGSYATRQLNASLGGPWRGWEYLALIDHSSSANDFRFHDDNGTQYNLRDDEWTRRRNSDFKALRALVKVGGRRGTTRLQLHNIFDLSNKGVPGIGNNQSLHTRFDTWRNITEATLFGPLSQGRAGYRLKAYQAFAQHQYKDLRGEVGIGMQHDRNNTRSSGLRGEINAVLPGGSLLTGFATGRREIYTPNSLLHRESRTLRSRRRGFSLGGEVETPLSTQRLTVNIGGQFELLDDRFFDAKNLLAGDLAPSKTKVEKLWGLRLGGQLELGWGWFARGHRGRYQRPPSFFELFGDKGAIIGNTDLVSEQGDNWDLGLVFRSDGDIDTGLLLAEAVYYANHVDDLIRFEHNSQQVSRPHNFGKAFMRGVENRLQLRLLARLELSVNYVYQRAENRAPFAFEKGRDLPNAPRHRFNARLALKGPGSGLHYEFSRESRHFLDRANLRPIATRTIHTMGGRTNSLGGLALSWEIRNLTANQVADLWGYPLPGRAYFLALNYQFTHSTR
ncbi:MAG: TonB-dependent receptor [Candidatus Latescibacteria bacterium]|nr:TonB-dependent receptor [Candidatus Latescibacterota bacterium]